jgi:hypothetical protein
VFCLWFGYVYFGIDKVFEMKNEQKFKELDLDKAIAIMKAVREIVKALDAEERKNKTAEMKAYAVELCNAKNIPFAEITEGYRFPEYVYIKHLICSKYYTQVPTSAIAELLNITTQQVRYLAVNYTNSETKFKHKKK